MASLGRLGGLLQGLAGGIEKGQQMALDRQLLQLRRDESENRKRQLEAEIQRADRAISAQEQNANTNALRLLDSRRRESLKELQKRKDAFIEAAGGNILDPFAGLMIGNEVVTGREQDLADFTRGLMSFAEAEASINAGFNTDFSALTQAGQQDTQARETTPEQTRALADQLMGNQVPSAGPTGITAEDIDPATGAAGEASLPQPQFQQDPGPVQTIRDPLADRASEILGPMGGVLRSPRGSRQAVFSVDPNLLDQAQDAVAASGLPEGSVSVVPQDSFDQAMAAGARDATERVMGRLDQFLAENAASDSDGNRTITVTPIFRKDEEGNDTDEVIGVNLPALDEDALGTETGLLGGVEVPGAGKLINTANALTRFFLDQGAGLSRDEANAMAPVTKDVLQRVIRLGVDEAGILVPGASGDAAVTLDPFHPAAPEMAQMVAVLQAALQQSDPTILEDQRLRVDQFQPTDVAPLFLSKWNELIGGEDGRLVPGTRKRVVGFDPQLRHRDQPTRDVFPFSRSDLNAFKQAQQGILIKLRDILSNSEGPASGFMSAATQKEIQAAIRDKNLVKVRPGGPPNPQLKKLRDEVLALLDLRGE